VEDGFRQSDVPCITVEKHHPRIRALVRRNPVQYWTFAFVGCEMVSAIRCSLYHCLKASPSPSRVCSSKSSTILDLRFCSVRNGFSDRAFPVSLLKSITLAFERLLVEIRYGIGPSLLLDAKWFRRSGVLCITVEKRHPRLRASVRRNPGFWHVVMKVVV
jgi:hypothetical protein